MDNNKYLKIKENNELRNKLLCLGLACPSNISRNQNEDTLRLDAIFFTGYNDTNTSTILSLDTSWPIPNPNPYIKIINDNEISIPVGIYEISLSGLISNADDTHGGEIYVQDDTSSAVKDLLFTLPINTDKQMYFSKTIIFRFEKDTTLQVLTNILGNENTSNVSISNVTLSIKKIHEK